MSKRFSSKNKSFEPSIQVLTLAELHIVQLAIVDARETEQGSIQILHYALMLCVMPKLLAQLVKMLTNV